jgi:hypothetical protein
MEKKMAAARAGIKLFVIKDVDVERDRLLDKLTYREALPLCGG